MKSSQGRIARAVLAVTAGLSLGVSSGCYMTPNYPDGVRPYTRGVQQAVCISDLVQGRLSLWKRKEHMSDSMAPIGGIAYVLDPKTVEGLPVTPNQKAFYDAATDRVDLGTEDLYGLFYSKNGEIPPGTQIELTINSPTREVFRGQIVSSGSDRANIIRSFPEDTYGGTHFYTRRIFGMEGGLDISVLKEVSKNEPGEYLFTAQSLEGFRSNTAQIHLSNSSNN